MNLPLNEVAEIDTVSAIPSCVAEGLGVSVVPQIAIDDCNADLLCLPFGQPQLHRDIGLVERENSTRGPVISELHRLLGEASGPYGVTEG